MARIRKAEVTSGLTLESLLSARIIGPVMAILAIGGWGARLEYGLQGAQTELSNAATDVGKKASKEDLTTLSGKHEELRKVATDDHEKLAKIDTAEIKSDHDALQQLKFEQKQMDTNSSKQAAELAALQQLMKSIELAVNTMTAAPTTSSTRSIR